MASEAAMEIPREECDSQAAPMNSEECEAQSPSKAEGQEECNTQAAPMDSEECGQEECDTQAAPVNAEECEAQSSPKAEGQEECDTQAAPVNAEECEAQSPPKAEGQEDGDTEAAPMNAEEPEAQSPPKAKGGVITPKRKARKGSKDPNKPKMPAGGGYGVYLTKHRSEITKSLPAGYKITDVSKKAGGQWKALSEEEKKPYEEEYKVLQASYKQAMESYVPPAGAGTKRVGGYILEQTKPKCSSPDAAAEGSAPTEDGEVVTPPRKAPRTVKRRPLTTMDIDPKVLAEAQRLCLEGHLMEFAGSPEVLDRGILAKKAANQRMLLKDLQRSKGSVEEARRRMSMKKGMDDDVVEIGEDVE